MHAYNTCLASLSLLLLSMPLSALVLRWLLVLKLLKLLLLRGVCCANKECNPGINKGSGS